MISTSTEPGATPEAEMDTTPDAPPEETWDDIPEDIKALSTDDILTRIRLIDNDIKVHPEMTHSGVCVDALGRSCGQRLFGYNTSRVL